MIEEPLGGAHRDVGAMATALRNRLIQELDLLNAVPLHDLVESRYRRLRQYGAYQG